MQCSLSEPGPLNVRKKPPPLVRLLLLLYFGAITRPPSVRFLRLRALGQAQLKIFQHVLMSVCLRQCLVADLGLFGRGSLGGTCALSCLGSLSIGRRCRLPLLLFLLRLPFLPFPFLRRPLLLFLLLL